MTGCLFIGSHATGEEVQVMAVSSQIGIIFLRRTFLVVFHDSLQVIQQL